MLVELRLVEHRYQAVLEVLNNGATVTDVARRHGVARQTVHGWLTCYAASGLSWRMGARRRLGRPVGQPPMHNVLTGSLDQAVRWGWRSDNLARLATLPPVRQADVRPPSPADVMAAIDGADRSWRCSSGSRQSSADDGARSARSAGTASILRPAT